MQKERTFETNEVVYVVDHWGTDIGQMAFSARAEIIRVDESKKIFLAVLYGDTYEEYSFKDYGRLIFDTKDEADEAANKFPSPHSVIYQKDGKNVSKKTVVGISGHSVNHITDLFIQFDDETEVSSKELGVSIFTKESDVRQ